eukprot:CAMPEP_0202444054 /NCGR_PEP_ID=MMETSP1360-20130828/3202_1 /ASSEMBLY_ACC=CAM_ASM_000848 /TAXON_ID=515479 /ORGANISM="Licmophora paradoxa, Strain CCMP2313" /LENGTH=192 /DNA_ID=CAMNT_0049059925 /DNA_START=152 /DNA_END=730 /DNA_ORIENTATION=-
MVYIKRELTTSTLFNDAPLGKTPSYEKEQNDSNSLEGICNALNLLPTLFDLWDVDQSGCIGREEVISGIQAFCLHYPRDATSCCPSTQDKSLMKSKILTHEECLDLFDEVDENCTGTLNRSEFEWLMSIFARMIDVPFHDVVSFTVDHFQRHPLVITRESKISAAGNQWQTTSAFRNILNMGAWRLDDEVSS